MKPTTQQILALLQRHQGLWVSHADLAIVGGHRYGARIAELRNAQHRVSQRGQGEGSQYRYDGPPPSPYDHFSCICGWEGDEPQAMRGLVGYLCPLCGRAVGQAEKVAQVSLL